MGSSKLKSPFPYFGGKAHVAKVIWQGFGEVANYVEPFAGSLAVLLANPKVPKIETVNDKDYFVANFWRAVSINPEEVAKWADSPVNEADLHARHRWLVSGATDDFKMKMDTDPDYFDAKIAGWWVWGMGASIGNNWLNTKGLRALPILSSAGGGIHGLTNDIYDWFNALKNRLRRTRVACGDWTKVITPSITYKNKGLSSKDITAVFLDPPYDLNGRDKVYQEDNDVFYDTLNWAVENGNNSNMRIVLCGYDGDYSIPNDWKTYAWKANGGLANLGNDRGKDNAAKERIYFSPHCLGLE